MFLNDNQLASRFGVSRATIWRWVSHENFPQPIRFSPNCTRWRLADVENWEQARAGAGAA